MPGLFVFITILIVSLLIYSSISIISQTVSGDGIPSRLSSQRLVNIPSFQRRLLLFEIYCNKMLLQIGSFAPSAASVLLSFSPPHPRFISSVPLSGTRTLIYLQVLFMFHHSREQRTTPRRLENGSWPVFQRLYIPTTYPSSLRVSPNGKPCRILFFCGFILRLVRF